MLQNVTKRCKTSRNIQKRPKIYKNISNAHPSPAKHDAIVCFPCIILWANVSPDQDQPRLIKASQASWYYCIILRTSWKLFENSDDVINLFYCIMLWTSLNLFINSDDAINWFYCIMLWTKLNLFSKKLM